MISPIERRRVLMLTSTYPRWAGDSSAEFVRDLAHHVADGLGAVGVLAPHSPGAARTEVDDGVPVRRFRYFWPERGQDIAYGGGGVTKIKKTPAYALKLLGFVLSQLYWTIRIVQRERIDVINPHWIVPQGFVAILAGRLTRRPVVLTVHGTDITHLRGRLMTMIKRIVLSRADTVVANTEATAQACREVYDRPYLIIPMGVSPARFAHARPGRAVEARADRFVIFFAGRLVPLKGVTHLIDAALRLADDGVDFTLLIAGDGPLRETLIEQAAPLGDRVRFLGWLVGAELADCYAQADVFVAPSLSEQQGIVLLEALGSGTPVLATAVGGIPEVITDGHNGYLVAPGESGPLYVRLAQLAANPDVRARLAAHAQVPTGYTWPEVARRYREVLGGGTA